MQDMIDAMKKIENYIQGTPYDAFAKHAMMIDAVIRNLTVVGEAANHIPEEIQQKHPEVRWRGIVGLRNLAVYEYFELKATIIWKIITEDLPLTKKLVIAILEKNKSDEIQL